MTTSLLAIDLQNDFTSPGGKHYIRRPVVAFLERVLFPWLTDHKIRVNEIISDYRQPRPGDRDESCIPGTWGYESIVPPNLVKARWIKCMNSPVWVRTNGGNPRKRAGLPHQGTHRFGNWLLRNVGNRERVTPVVFGLTIDCCVLSTVQELNWRGYRPIILREGVDHYTGKSFDKNAILHSPINNWATVMSWKTLRTRLHHTA